MINQESTRAVGVYAISLVFTLSTNAAAGTFLRQFWWVSLLAFTLPAVVLSAQVDDKQKSKGKENGKGQY